jgi:hypothetical protein
MDMSVLTMRAARLVAVTMLLVNAGTVWAAESARYPVKPVRMIIAQTTGTSVDTLARVLAQRMGEELGQGGLSIRTRDPHHTNFFRRISIKVRRHSPQGTSTVLHTNPRELGLFCFLL